MRIYADLARGIERLGGFGGRSDVLAESMTYGGDPHSYMQQLGWMAAAGVEDVKAAGRTWLGAGIRHYTLTVVPYPKLDEGGDSSGSLAGAGTRGSGDGDRIPRDPARDLAQRPAGPPARTARRAARPDGARGRRRIRLRCRTTRRAWRRWRSTFSTTAPTTRDTFRIADELDALGATISTDSSLDFSYVRLKALAPTLRGALDVYADVVLRAGFPENLVELEKRSRLARIAQERVQPTAAALRIVPGLLYGVEHPYGKPGTGSGFESTVQALHPLGSGLLASPVVPARLVDLDRDG